MLSLEKFFSGFLQGIEGGLSLDTADKGNWAEGKLIGSKFGVTPAALAKHRKVPVSKITRQEMANLKLEEAIDVGIDDYYRAPGFDDLAWDRVVAAAVDHGYNRGQENGIKVLQRIIGTKDDGDIGAGTMAAYAKAKLALGEEKLANLLADARIKDYESLHDAKYINGWRNRANSFRPGTPWWKSAK